MNPLFNYLKPNAQNPFDGIIEQAKEFKQKFNGNPQQEVQRLLNSGQMSQEEFNRLSQTAQQVLRYMNQ